MSDAENKYGKTVSNLDSKTKPGSELIIQKFSIYNQKPDDLGKSLKSYSLFNKPGCGQAQAKGLNQTSTNQTNALLPTPNSGASPNSNITPLNSKPSLPLDNIPGSNLSISTIDATSLSQQINQQNNNCLTLDVESDGVVATGTIQDVKILEKFLGDQDKPLKQVMIEAYILEVNNDWASKIQSKISNAGGSVLSVAGMNTVPDLVTGLKFSTTFGSHSEIQALVNLIETNSLGRKISNPVILVQDGQTGVVNKTRTVYEILTTTVPGAVGTNNTITQEAKPLESPLKLSVTPTANKHNDNISLKFDFTETIRDSDTYTAPTTANTITTTLNVEPGAVVMMAGLRKETNAITSNGAPILSKYGLSAMFAPLTALFGGENSRSTSGSELLVLINPTVITSKGLKNTIEKAK
jgi:type II secretory pathway component GspD/PulD (secretin)